MVWRRGVDQAFFSTAPDPLGCWDTRKKEQKAVRKVILNWFHQKLASIPEPARYLRLILPVWVALVGSWEIVVAGNLSPLTW